MFSLKNVILFTIGGGTYTALELALRRKSHISMFFLGGACFVAIGKFQQKRPHMGIPARMAAGSAICTAGELAVGLVFNRDHSIWDYRSLPGNYRGQISLPFSLLWMPLSAVGGSLYRWCDKRL